MTPPSENSPTLTIHPPVVEIRTFSGAFGVTAHFSSWSPPLHTIEVRCDEPSVELLNVNLIGVIPTDGDAFSVVVRATYAGTQAVRATLTYHASQPIGSQEVLVRVPWPVLLLSKGGVLAFCAYVAAGVIAGVTFRDTAMIRYSVQGWLLAGLGVFTGAVFAGGIRVWASGSPKARYEFIALATAFIGVAALSLMRLIF
jgi:hypothetical protein